MANTGSAIKRIRQTKRRTTINRRNKTRLRSQIKKLRQAIEAKDTKAAQELLKPTISLVDRSVQQKVIKKNNASRVKSRLTVRVNALQTSASPSAES